MSNRDGSMIPCKLIGAFACVPLGGGEPTIYLQWQTDSARFGGKDRYYSTTLPASDFTATATGEDEETP